MSKFTFNQEVDAFQLSLENLQNKQRWPQWFRDAYKDRKGGLNTLWPDWESVTEEVTDEEGNTKLVQKQTYSRFWLHAWDGMHLAEYDDWIVYNKRGELYVYNTIEFKDKFSAVVE